MSKKTCYLTHWVGDYHAPRLKSLSSALRLAGGHLSVVQFGSKSSFYSHPQTRREKLCKELDFIQRPPTKGIASCIDVWRCLGELKPRYIFVLGYNDSISLTALIYAKVHRLRIFFMSDSKADDQDRTYVGEKIKSLIIKQYSGALVAGHRHCEYFRSLGYRGPIETGYDVVDNSYFSRRSDAYARKNSQLRDRCSVLEKPYVLCVSRLVNRKRVPLALEIFALSGLSKEHVKFVLVGDGPELSKTMEKVEALGLSESFVHIRSLPNHRMPAVYSRAVALILASEYDQWGLCVNEAMSCGVPALVSYRCGVATEIVTEHNGFVFEDGKIESAAKALRKIALNQEYRAQLSTTCRGTMAQWNLDRFSSSAMRLIYGCSEK